MPVIIKNSCMASKYIWNLYLPEYTKPDNCHLVIELNNSSVAEVFQMVCSGVTIDWGDGTSEVVTNTTKTYTTHTYTDGKYSHIIMAYGGTITEMERLHDKNKSASIKILEPIPYAGSSKLAYRTQVSYITPNLLINYPKETTSLKGLFEYDYTQDEVDLVIPENLLDNLPELTDVSDLFSQRAGIRYIPENLFKNQTKITQFTNTFFETGIKSIPRKLFATNIHATNFASCFSNIESLQIADVEIYSDTTEAVNVSGLFANTRLKTINMNMLNFPNATSINMDGLFGGWYYQREFASISSEFFINCKSATSANTAFRGCGFTDLPDGLFKYTPKITQFYNCFYYNDFLVHLTGDPWKGFTGTEAIDVSWCFQDCDNLETVPDTIFQDLNPDAAHDFSGCFSARGLKHCPRLWEVFPNAIGTDCFDVCFDADNYNDVPASWGGPAENV